MEDYYNKLKNDFLIQDQSLLRFGSIGDGGYFLRPETITNSNVLFSGGISSNLEFEYDLFRFNERLQIIMVDPTVSGNKLVLKGLARLFFKKPDKIRYLFNALIFNFLIRQKRCEHLKLWLNTDNSILKLSKHKLKADDKILLKFDIEGGEYDFFDEITSNLSQFSALVFEFHDVHKMHNEVYNFLQKCSTQFNLVYLGINPSGGFDGSNRPKCIEVTLEPKK
ncbi:FkbM family methyltransferase [Olleya aquimaris]|uniref:Methyltransferase FkbM-like protein n=1 Tax=Olleya aquimaris TaxID=639310 RepID=A0A327RLC3_9FLAO|nr:FkbM family methyltransferase [Olleya aquimaris]RAJ16995.1 methyltransferase FkbM-like protein [Olleya aquimaris]